MQRRFAWRSRTTHVAPFDDICQRTDPRSSARFASTRAHTLGQQSYDPRDLLFSAIRRVKERVKERVEFRLTPGRDGAHLSCVHQVTIRTPLLWPLRAHAWSCWLEYGTRDRHFALNLICSMASKWLISREQTSFVNKSNECALIIPPKNP